MTSEARDIVERRAGLEMAARWLEDKAQQWRRERDPGMANQAQAYANAIRKLVPTPSQETQ